MTNYVIYARKSTESEDRQILSIDSQIKELANLAQRREFVIQHTFTESKSAKAPGRPVFDEMLKAITKNKVSGILCWKLDRLARNPVDGAALIWALEQGRLSNIITPHRDFLNRGDDKFWMQLEFGMAKKYVDDLSDNVRRGIRAKIERGWKPGRPPVGYCNDPETRTIVPDSDRFSLVRKMWDLMITGNYTPYDIADIANDQWGFRTRRTKRAGDRPISVSTLYKLLENPFYAGIIVHKLEQFKGAHKPMVSMAEFENVQKLLGRPDRERPKRHCFAYTGLIRCGECGASVTAEEQVNRFGSHYIYYHCTRRKRRTDCKQSYVRVETLEGQMGRVLELITISDAVRSWALKWMEREKGKESKDQEAIIRQVQGSLAAVKRQLETLTGLRLRDLLTDTEFVQQKEKLVSRQVNLEQRLSELHKSATGWFEPFRKTILFLNIAKNRFDSAKPEEKRVIISSVGSNLLLKDRKLLTQLKKPFIFFTNVTACPVNSGQLHNVRTFFMKYPDVLGISVLGKFASR